MELIPHCLTAGVPFAEFGVWLSLVSSRPLAHPVLYLRKVIPDAAPKCISGRTSYLRVRLAFYPYPQLIPSLCNVNGFGPPPRYYRGFSLAMGSSHGFGSTQRDWLALFRLAFATAPALNALTLPRKVTRRLILQ